MLILADTNDTFRVVTDQNLNVDVVANYVDAATPITSSSSTTPGNQPTAITTATTTVVLASPAVNTARNLKSLSVRNKSATTAVTVTVQFFDGATAFEIVSEVLAAGAELFYEDRYGWQVFSNSTRITQQVLVGAGTYNTPAGVKAIKTELVAGGGAGGSCLSAVTNAAGAGGGGSGGYSESLILNPAVSYAYSVGAAGVPGAAGANPGGNGGDSSFNGGAVLAKGGTGGAADTVAAGPRVGGAGGAGGITGTAAGDIKIAGSPGSAGLALAAAQCVSGVGGASVYGGAGAQSKNATGAGGAAGNYGGGGGGGSIISGGASQQGGAGGIGTIVVTEYR